MNRRSGMTMLEIMIVVAIIGLLAVIALPSFLQSRTKTQEKICLNNLRLMDAAKEQAALAHMWANNRAVASGSAEETAVLEYMKGGLMPACPAAGTYAWNNIDQPPSCSVTNHFINRS
jgi:prepilin-type N-terminal cleavage/methylation domain-containing protein